MADGEHGALEVQKVFLEPLGGAQIKVVRGLIQQQDVGFFKYEPCEVDPGALTAGERVKKLLPHPLWDIQTVCNAVAVYLHLIAAHTAEILGKAVVFRQKPFRRVILHLLCKLLEPCAYRVKLSVRVAQNVFRCPIRGIHRYLRYEPNALSGGYGHRAFVIVYFAYEDTEQRGLAAAVMAENADALTLGNVEAEPVKYIFTQFKGLDKSVDGYICHVFSPENYLTAA